MVVFETTPLTLDDVSATVGAATRSFLAIYNSCVRPVPRNGEPSLHALGSAIKTALG